MQARENPPTFKQRVSEEGKVGRTRATTDEWRAYYERADRARKQHGDPFEKHIRARQRRNTVFTVCVTVTLLGIVAALAAWIFSDLGAL